MALISKVFICATSLHTGLQTLALYFVYEGTEVNCESWLGSSYMFAYYIPFLYFPMKLDPPHILNPHLPQPPKSCFFLHETYWLLLLEICDPTNCIWALLYNTGKRNSQNITLSRQLVTSWILPLQLKVTNKLENFTSFSLQKGKINK